MTFRTRLQLSFAALAVVAVGGLAAGVRVEMARRVKQQYQNRVTSLVQVIREDLEQESQAIGARLAALAQSMADDNRLRLALAGNADRAYVLDYAGKAMRVAGLSMLQIQDSRGRIISSGHFRNEFDRLDPDFPGRVATAPGGLAVAEARAPEGLFLVLARADSARVAGSWLHLVGGRTVSPGFLRQLARDRDLAVRLETPMDTLISTPKDAPSPANAVADAVTLPFVRSGGGVGESRLVVMSDLTALAELQRGVDRWSLFAGLLAVGLAFGAATLLSARLSQPLAELAGKTATLDLQRLDVDFATSRDDEVGALARLLGAMTDRLRRGTRQLREAERRATVGDIARQVNHDVKNGLVPIRNVIRHLAEVSQSEPHQLPDVFRERKATLDSGVQYLETLAANYARLTPGADGGETDAAELVNDVVRGAGAGGINVMAEITPGVPPVRAGTLLVRRILENLVGNAVDAAGPRGSVIVSLMPAPSATGGALMAVTDTGPGMSSDELERAMQDFYTTKPGGTGLGLSIVRRLVADIGGTLTVQTGPGAGTRAEVLLPTAPSNLAGGA